MKALLGIKFIMSISKLPFLVDYWETQKCIIDEKIQNFVRFRYFPDQNEPKGRTHENEF